MFLRKKNQRKLEILIEKISKYYSKPKDKVIETLLDFILKSDLDYFNSQTFANKKKTEKFRKLLENTEELKKANQIISSKINAKKEQYEKESLKKIQLLSELEIESQKLKKLKNENNDLRKQIFAINKQVKIIEYKNHNKKIQKFQEHSPDYRKHQFFLVLITIIGIIIAVFLFFIKTK